LLRALEVLSSYKEKKLKKVISLAGKLVVRRSEYEKILRSEDFEEIVNNILEIENEIKAIDEKIADIKPEINQLESWSCYKGNLEDIKETEIYTIKLGIIKYERSDFREVLKKLNENKISCEKLSERKDSAYVILAFHNQFKRLQGHY